MSQRNPISSSHHASHDDSSFNNQDSTCPGTSSNDLLLLQGIGAYGRTGNNLIEFLHALQYARDNDVTLGIMSNSWAFRLILDMWMSVQDDDWQTHFEEEFCVKIFHHQDEWKGYNLLLPELQAPRLLTQHLFMYKSNSPLHVYIGHQVKYLQTLFRHYNNGDGPQIEASQFKICVQDLMLSLVCITKILFILWFINVTWKAYQAYAL